MYDVLLTGGLVPAGGRFARLDVAIADRTIAAIEPELRGLPAREVIDADGCRVLPGVVDPHVHLSGRFGSALGFRMLVRAGVTAALDLAGDPADLKATLPEKGCGLAVGVLFPLIPGDSVSGPEPDTTEIEQILDQQLEQGALGLKVLGGHYPLTPTATADVIDVCARRSAYCAVHVGTTATGSDVTGVEELVALADGNPVHMAHVNSYCRGQIDDPVTEAARVLHALRHAPNVRSESYLSLINGAEALCADGEPVSRVVRTCLRLGGYAETEAGITEAIRDGWGAVQEERDDENGFADHDRGVELFKAQATAVGISFPVNPPPAILALALARHMPGRDFVVDAFSSDGGSIPRNTTLTQALALVDGGFLTPSELVHKACTAPAEMLGLASKGRLEVGADADLITADASRTCRDSIVGGEIVMRNRIIVKSGGGILREFLRL